MSTDVASGCFHVVTATLSGIIAPAASAES